MEMLKLLVAPARGADARRHDRGRPARSRARRRAAAREHRQHDQARGARSAFAPDAVRRLGALGVAVAEDAERLRERLRLANAEYERLRVDGRRLVADLAGDWASGQGASCSTGSGRERFADRVLLAWARSPRARPIQPGGCSRRCRERWTVPVFPLKAADFIARGVAEGPGARRGARGRRGGVDRGGISGGCGGDSRRSRMRRWPRPADPCASPARRAIAISTARPPDRRSGS